MGGEVVHSVVVRHQEGRPRLGGGGFDVLNPRFGRESGDVVPDVRPASAVVPGDLDVSIVGSHPDHTGFHRGFGHGVDGGVELGRRVVVVDLAPGVQLLLRVVGGEVRADDVPGIAVVPASEEDVPAPVDHGGIVGGDDDGGVPVKAVPGLAHVLALGAHHPGVGLDGPGLAGPGVGDAEVPALGVGVDQPGLARNGNRVESVPAAHRVPLVGQDGPAPGFGGAAPVSVVLEASADPVGIPVVHEDVVELGEVHVPPDVEVDAAVEAHLESAVASGKHMLSVGRIDPDGLVVSVDPRCDPLEGPSPVGGFGHPPGQGEDRVRVGRIDENVGVVEGPEVQVPVVVHHPPVLPVVVGPEEGAGRGELGDEVDDVGGGLGHAEPGRAMGSSGRVSIFFQLSPPSRET